MASHKIYAMPFYFFFNAYSVETVSSFRFSAPADEFIGEIHAQLLLKLPGRGVAHKNLPVGYVSFGQFPVYIISFQCLGYAHPPELREHKEHADRAHVVVLACDSKCVASFMVGDTEMCVKELCESALRHKSFLDLLKGILETLQT